MNNLGALLGEKVKNGWCENPLSHPLWRESLPAIAQDRNPAYGACETVRLRRIARAEGACEIGISHEQQSQIDDPRRPVLQPGHQLGDL